MPSYIQELVLVLGTTLLLLAASICGVYHLGMAYISSEFGGLLDGLYMNRQPSPEQDIVQMLSTPDGSGLSPQPNVQEQVGSDFCALDGVAALDGMSELALQPNKGTSNPSITSRPLQLVGAMEMVNGDSIAQTLASLGLTTAERQHAQSLLPIIRKLSLHEKLFALQCVSKFTVSELVQMFRWYRQGDSTAIEQIKQRFYERFSAEDIRRILQIADKYR